MNNIKKLLSRLGLGVDASLVYLFLIQAEPCGVTDIARKLGLHRPAVYRAISELEQYQLVSVVSGRKQKHYAAEPPEQLRALVKVMLSELDTALPVLTERYSARGKAPLVRVLEGRKGIERVFADVIERTPKGGTFYRITAEKDLARTNTYLPKDYREKRDAKQLERFVISAKSVGVQKKNRLERAIKFFPDSNGKNDVVFDQDTIELIYEDTIAFIDLNTETAMLVESAPLAEFQKKLFRLLYQRL